ncbi:MAG: hypothetical protein EZS28_007122 [Streblomastix strix]|uniref:Uncharacterized protein n=1 Tax=Streblomastix strix TaxID=222440 RepID=A0A5J4WR12_9EUKA|nr:MAG: hypothetical protein EZS28_007122 [Streblomastix strix]
MDNFVGKMFKILNASVMSFIDAKFEKESRFEIIDEKDQEKYSPLVTYFIINSQHFRGSVTIARVTHVEKIFEISEDLSLQLQAFLIPSKSYMIKDSLSKLTTSSDNQIHQYVPKDVLFTLQVRRSIDILPFSPLGWVSSILASTNPYDTKNSQQGEIRRSSSRDNGSETGHINPSGIAKWRKPIMKVASQEYFSKAVNIIMNSSGVQTENSAASIQDSSIAKITNQNTSKQEVDKSSRPKEGAGTVAVHNNMNLNDILRERLTNFK